MNRLQFEKSPYLLQHKSNPVDWYPWGSEALEKAVKEDKPILLSIGYSSCHWCHVMEQESFTDPLVAEYMNHHFINIKLDREERPDLDKIYMDAVVSISGSGGWPLNCFLLPDKKPFYGGTYFPPSPRHQRPSWSQILQHIVRIFKEKRVEVEEQAGRLIRYVSNASSTLLEVASKDHDLATDAGVKIFQHLKNRFDRSNGGFGGAPKFPSTMTLKFLLDHYFYTGQLQGLQHVISSLEHMARGGIFDQIGGGFARYTTDTAWRIPHFEKMLYDNALFMSLYSQAFKISPGPILKKVVSQSATWLTRDMKSSVGGYYSAMDADSEHVEGKYYVWDYNEIKKLLNSEDFKLFESVYDIHPEGNWADPSHTGGAPINILWVRNEFEDELTYCSKRLQSVHEELLKQRDTRIAPLKDTKIITAWNALLCMGWFDAYDAFGTKDFLQEAVSILTYFKEIALVEERYLHQYESEIPAMLDDLAYGILAFLYGYRSTGNKGYLSKARLLAKHVMHHYYLPAQKSFRYSVSTHDLVAEVNDLYDNTMPSASGAMAYNLVYLGRVLSIDDWELLGNELITDLRGAIIRYPDSLSHWASLTISQDIGWMEVKSSAEADIDSIRSLYLPSPILHFLEEKNADISLCHQFSCEMPVNSIQEFRSLLDKHYHLDEER